MCQDDCAALKLAPSSRAWSVAATGYVSSLKDAARRLLHDTEIFQRLNAPNQTRHKGRSWDILSEASQSAISSIASCQIYCIMSDSTNPTGLLGAFAYAARALVYRTLTTIDYSRTPRSSSSSWSSLRPAAGPPWPAAWPSSLHCYRVNHSE